MRNILVISGSLLLSGLLICSSANAAVLQIKNENKKDLEIVIEPGEGTVLPNKEATKRVLKAGEDRKIEVSEKDFPDSSTFVVIGKVNIPSLHNQCGPLFIDKDYRLSFTQTSTGATACHYETLHKK